MQPIGRIILFVIFFLATSCSPNNELKVGKCDDLQRKSGMSFGAAYCQGDFCSHYEDQDGKLKRVTGKADCVAIDVVVNGNIEEWGQDGEGDCSWIEETCLPNK